MGDLAGMDLVPEQPSWQQLSGRAGGSFQVCHQTYFIRYLYYSSVENE